MFIDTRDLNDSSPVRGDMTTGRAEADHRSFHAAPLGLVGFMERRCYKHVTPTGLAAPARNRCRGVTLIEMLVAVSLLVLIMGALFLSFYQVQRAYGVATSQQDVLEGGRAIASLVRRDLAGTSGCGCYMCRKRRHSLSCPQPRQLVLRTAHCLSRRQSSTWSYSRQSPTGLHTFRLT